MGSNIDEQTQLLLDTLERLKLYDPFPFEDVYKSVLSNFSRPNEIMMSPQMYKDLKKAISGDTEE